jgi:hypothetical protein
LAARRHALLHRVGIDTDAFLKQVQPTEVTITKRDVMIDSPEAATVDMLVRASGNVLPDGMPGTVLVGLRVSMLKKDGEWLLREAEF